MVFHRLAHHLRPTKDFGRSLYHNAHRVGSAVDKGMRFAKQAYGIVAPALREFGVNTSQLDGAADRGFTGYSQLRDRVVQGSDIVHRTAGRLAGLT